MIVWNDGAALGAIAVSTGVLGWTLTGFPQKDVRRAASLLVTSTREEAVLLGRAARGIFSALWGRLGGGARAQPTATLGEVSEMIDIVRLGLLAGLSFDAALGLYCEERSTALASRMAQARLSWQTGLLTREEALLDAARDLDVRALETFASAVGQALDLGAPLSDTLLRQSREIRAAHRASVERQIEQAPIKLLIPTGTLILPALLLSILGPLLAASGML